MIGTNIRFLRKKIRLTQQALAEKLGIKRSLIGAYEEGRANPKLDTLMKLSDFFGLSFEHLLLKDLTRLTDEDLEDLRTERKADIEGRRLRVLPIVLDKDDNENVVLVPEKAAAGYLDGYADPEYIEELYRFNLPNLGKGTYRAFEISGDSMLPIKPGTIIVGEYIQNWRDIKNDQTYIVVSQSEGIVYKRIINQISDSGEGSLLLKSDNPNYNPYELEVEDVLEIWKAKTYISNEFPEPEYSMEKLTAIVLELQQEVIRMKNTGAEA